MPTTEPSLNLEALYRPLWLTYGLVRAPARKPHGTEAGPHSSLA